MLVNSNNFYLFTPYYCNVLDMAAAEAMELGEEEGLIEIAEEADLIQAERIIDDYDPRFDKDGTKKRNMESDVRKVEEMMLAMNLDKADIQAEQKEEGWMVKIQGIFFIWSNVMSLTSRLVCVDVNTCM